MTTRRELCFCESYARECFSGAGIIADLGCWLGATTYCFARGLTENTAAKENRRIEAFDRFAWDDCWLPVAEAIQMPVKYHAGQSFFQEVQELLSPYRQIVQLHPGDLLEYVSSQEPIEMLFVDAMKSWPLARKIFSAFFPRLIAGVSVVVQQDFAYHVAGGAMNHLLMWRMRDYFRPIHFVPASASLAFLCTKPIAAADLPNASPTSFSLDEIDEAYDYSLAAVPEERGQLLIEAAKFSFLLERKHDEAALANAKRLLDKNKKFTAPVISDIARIIQARKTSQRREPNGNAGDIQLLAAIESVLPELAPASAVVPPKSA